MREVSTLVGYTRTQKEIHQYSLDPLRDEPTVAPDFTPEDCFDAVAVFTHLQIVYLRRYGEDSQEYRDGLKMLTFHTARTTTHFRASQKDMLGIVTVLDLAKYGRKHTVSYLKELV